MLKKLRQQFSSTESVDKKFTEVTRESTVNPDMELLIAERDELSDSLKVYQKRIQILETEAADLLKSYDILYNENKILRGKLDRSDTADHDSIQNMESYNVIYKDRQYLKEANKALKRKQKQLEDERDDIMRKYNEINTENKLLQQKADLLEQHTSHAKDGKIVDLEKHKQEMEERLLMFLKEREQYIYRLSEVDKERNEIQNKYDFLLVEKKDLQLKCDILEVDRAKLKESIKDLEEKIPDPVKKAKDEQLLLSLQAQVIALQISNKDANAVIEGLKNEIHDLNKLQSRDNLIDRSTSVMSMTEEEKAKQQEELEKKEEMTEELNQSKQRCIVLLKENDNFKLRNIELESINANIELEKQSLYKDIGEKEKIIQELSNKLSLNAGLDDELESLQDQLKDLTAANTVLEKELKQETRISKEKIRELQASLNETQLKLRNAENRSSKLESDRSHFQEEYENLAKSLETQALDIRNLRSRNEQLQNLHEDKNDKYEDIKKKWTEASVELRDLRIELNLTKQELEESKADRKGHIGILNTEMKTVMEDRQGETEQMKKETERLKQEITRLKDFEFKITTMDAEMRRLMNRLRMAERYRKTERIKAGIKEKVEIDEDKEQIKELRRKVREAEREKMILLQEQRQWEITKEKYAEIQLSNKRLIHENKRVRTEMEGTQYRVGTLETKLRSLNLKIEEKTDTKTIQMAKYVDNSQSKSEKVKGVQKKDKATQPVKRLKPISETSELNDFGSKLVNEIQDYLTHRRTARPTQRSKTRRRVERQSTRTALDNSRMRATKPTFPKLQKDSERALTGGSYKELHSKKYKNKGSLELL